jgi:hypothetical protein
MILAMLNINPFTQDYTYILIYINKTFSVNTMGKIDCHEAA